jgi:TolA-binding protein
MSAASMRALISLCMSLCISSHILLLSGCSSSGAKHPASIADLQHPAETINPRVDFELSDQQLIDAYRQLVSITPQGTQYGKEMQRLADLELEASMDNRLSDKAEVIDQGKQQSGLAIRRYQEYLDTYPDRSDNDIILYQLSRAYELNSQTEKSQQVMQQLVTDFPRSRYIDEIQFRRGEDFFVSADYAEAEKAYDAVASNYPDSIFYEKSLYKLGWSRFKQNKIDKALDSFVQLLDLKEQQQQLGEASLPESLARSDQELIEDVLRVTSLSFSYLESEQAIAAYFEQAGHRQYEPLLYNRLAALYLSKERTTDAADTYLSYTENYPYSELAPVFHGQAIDVYKRSAFSSLLLAEKQNFVKKYNTGSDFWSRQNSTTHTGLQPILTSHMSDIATHYHAIARTSKKPADYRLAAQWYQLYLDSFPLDINAAEINFLLAESRYEAGQYAIAIAEYEKTAYVYPAHKNSAEAAYAALIAYDMLYQSSDEKDRPKINDDLIQSSLKFSYLFPGDKRMPDVLLKTAEQFFDLKQYDQASSSAERLVNNPDLELNIKHRAWIVIAHSNFEIKNYPVAEQAYTQVIKGLPEKDKSRENMSQQLASAIYKQGEQERASDNHQLAAHHFLRVGKTVPGSSIRIIADYDAATEYLAMEQWPEVISQLEAFRKKYPEQNKWRLGVSQKLTLAYNNTGRYAKAAGEMMTLIELSPKDQQQDLLWQAAELYNQAGEQEQTIAIYKTYIKQYPDPLSRTVELRHKIAQYYLAENDDYRYQYWLKQIVKADAAGGLQRTDRTRYLAATASLELVKPKHDEYSSTKLTTPLKKSLDRKKQLMKQAIDGYTLAAKYQVEEVTTAVTYNIAEIYSEFARSLLASERPKKLNEEELEEYNYLLEDQAYPFEEKAIKIHEKNLSRIPGGSFDESIKNSLSALSKLMPFRYDKSEMTDALVK